MRGDLIRGHLDSLLLAALQSGPTHGYGVIQRLRLTSDGALELAEGTVYPALHRLERDELIAAEETRVDGRRRRSYRLTDRGRQVLADRRAEWATFRDVMTVLMGAPA